MFVMENSNPNKMRVGDCVIRSISKALNQDWLQTYIDLCIQGYLLADLPSANHVWGTYLKGKGFKRDIVPDDCPNCYTIADFCREHPKGTYVIGTGSHAVCAIDGCYIDSWDSGGETPIYFYFKGE
jgi:hypothetical protein